MTKNYYREKTLQIFLIFSTLLNISIQLHLIPHLRNDNGQNAVFIPINPFMTSVLCDSQQQPQFRWEKFRSRGKREFAISRKTARWLLPITFSCTAKQAFLNIVVFIRVPPCLVIYGRYTFSNSALSRINIYRCPLLKILIREYQNPHFNLNFMLIPFPYPRVPLFLGPRLVKTANSEGRL